MKRNYNSVGQAEKPNCDVKTAKINSPGERSGQKVTVAKGSISSAVNRPGAQTEVRTNSRGSKFETNRPGGGEEAGRRFGPVSS